jgi:hypothetical protein
MTHRGILSFSAMALLCTTAALAQEEGEHKWNFNFGGGYTPAAGFTSDRLNQGGNVSAGGGYNLNRHIGIVGEFQYNMLGITNNALNILAVPGGDAHIWSLTANPVFRFPIKSRVSGYVIGGGGLYQRKVDFNQPLTSDTLVSDPWWGYTGASFVPAGQTLGSVTSTVGGVNIGGGLTVSLGSRGTKFYVESRYNRAFTAGSDTAYVPLTFGVRW